VIELERQGNLDHMTVRVELSQTAGPADSSEIAAALRHGIKSYIGVSCQVSIQQTGSIPRSEGKARRVIDKRKD
jgi:phenylacetate-CoA ligase